MVEKVIRYIEKHKMIKNGDTIVLGISGGADSVCLFLVLLELSKRYNLKLLAVHVNHNLRGDEALRDQKYVEDICKKYQVPCTVVSVDVKEEARKRKRSVEEAGREVRQAAMGQSVARAKEVSLKGDGTIARDEGYKIATAHHSNDNAETMLINLARGTGIGGLTGIIPVQGQRIRPLLCVTREEIEAYLKEHNQSYCTDSTNAENIYTRNVIRNQVVPKLEEEVNQQTVLHMNQAMEELQKIEDYLQMQLSQCWQECVEVDENQRRIVILQENLREQVEILQERVMKKALEEMAGCQRDIGRVHVSQLLELLEKQVGREIHLPYQLVGKRIYEGIEIRKVEENVGLLGMKMVIPGKTYLSDGTTVETRVLYKDEMDEIQEKPFTKYFEYDIMTEVPCIRTRDIGDYIVINGNGNRQTIKKYYVNNKVSEQLRDRIPLVTIGEEVIWIVGYRRSSNYVTDQNTNRVLEITYNGGNDVRKN